MVDEHKFCFIICSNSDYYLEECLFYINKLEVPAGYTIDLISITDAESMTNGYNEAMRATDAKYKIYLHQDVFIIYKGFLQAILDIFQSDATIGMIGMVGAPKMPIGGVMWYGHREGMIYGSNVVKGDYNTYCYQLGDGLHEVEAIDGLMMITAADITWREDKFDGWDFYDVSQSFEFRRNGYKVVVPEQLCPWCKHDGGVLNLLNFDKYRKICMTEYPEYFYPERFYVGRNQMGSQGRRICTVIIARNQFEEVETLIEILKAFSQMDERHIIIVDNGSDDGLRHWLRRQREFDYIVCGDVIEGYADILNQVVKEFVTDEDLLILSSGLMVLPGCIETLYDVLQRDKQIGAVCAGTDLNGSEEGCDFVRAAEYAQKYANAGGRKEIRVLPHEAVLIRNEMLRRTEGFDNRLRLPQNVMADFAFRGTQKGYHYYDIPNAFVYKISDSNKIYSKILGEDIDKQVLEQTRLS